MKRYIDDNFEERPKLKPLKRAEILDKLQYYCAYQERCQSEVLSKLKEIGVYNQADITYTLLELKKEGFLNEKRFANLYAENKHLFKRWGKVKIAIYLRQKRVPHYIINEALESIDDDIYYNTLTSLIDKKWHQLRVVRHRYKRQQKLLFYMQTKGYEYHLIKDYLKTLEH